VARRRRSVGHTVGNNDNNAHAHVHADADADAHIVDLGRAVA